VNGSFVTPRVDSFPWGQDFNLTITAQDIDAEALKYADVYLIWEENDLQFNHTSGENLPGNGKNGEYTFWITKEDQGASYPKNITIAVYDASSELSGYTNVTMEKPTLLPELEIGSITGGLRLKVQIKNIGLANATNVTVNITFSGAWMILPLFEHYQISFDLGAGVSKTIPVIVFGLGKTTIKVDMNCAEGFSVTKIATGKVFLFLIFGVQ
jgi:hypothetical protein